MTDFSNWTEAEILETIKGRIKVLDLNNYKIHKLTGITQSSIGRYLKGENKMSLGNFLLLLQALKLSMFLTPNENLIEEIDSSSFK